MPFQNIAQETFTGDYKYSAQVSNHGLWLKCDGSAVSRTTYSALFTLIGTTFGVGDNSTTFNIPDFRGKIAGTIGQGVGLTNRTLGQNVGTETHTLTVNEMPSHKHGVIAVGGATPRPDLGLRDYPAGFSTLTDDTSYVGGGLAHNNMQPTLFAGNIFIHI